jgi:hypothetical protein
MLLAARAQTRAQDKGPENASDASMELKLSAYESRVCRGSSVTLTLEVANTGERQIKIHRSNLWSQFSYSKVGSQSSGSSISCGVSDDSPQSWVAIEPGGKADFTLTYRLEHDQFFHDAGRYKLSTSLQLYAADKYVRPVKSSEAEFEVYDCAAK